MIERSRVRIPAGAAGEFSSPGSTFVLTLISVSVPPQCYRSSIKKTPVVLPKVQVAGYSCMHLTYVALHYVAWCMVVWCTQNAPRWQQFHVASAIPAL